MDNKFLSSYAADKRQDKSKRGTVQEESHASEVFVGQISDWSNPSGTFKRTIVAAEGMEQISDEMQNDYPSKAFMTMEGLIRPISLDGYGGLPQMIKYTAPVQVGTGSPSSGIVQDDLLPFTNPSGLERSSNARLRSDTPLTGHDFEILGRSGTVESTPSGGMIMPLAGFTNAYGSDYQDDYGAFGLRGPLVIHGWGYDTEGYPIPNKADVEAATVSGVFTSESRDPDKFLDNHLRKPHTWPVAPVDLRMDRARGVWTAGTATPAESDTEPSLGETRLMAVTTPMVTGCCVYEAIYRPFDFDVDDLCNVSGLIRHVWLHKSCDTLDYTNNRCSCVLGKYEAPSGTCDGNRRPVYSFLSIASDALYCAGVYTPCDCCCPDNEEGKKTAAIIEGCGIDQTIVLTYTTGVVLLDCTGGPAYSGLQGWEGDFYINVDYPVKLTEIQADLGVYGIDSLWLRTDYTDFTYSKAYVDEAVVDPSKPGGTYVEFTGDWSYDSAGGLCDYLFLATNPASGLEYETMQLRYHTFMYCDPEESQTDIEGRCFIAHMYPDGHPYTGSMIPDWEGAQSYDLCKLNTHKAYFDYDFGNGGCPIDVSFTPPIGGGSTYSFNPFDMHYFAMCKLNGGELCIDFTSCPASFLTAPPCDLGNQEFSITYLW